MVNEERIRLMTRMASYEQNEFRKDKPVVSFFRSDYTSLQLVKTIIATTIAYAILVGLYVLYDFELFMKEIYQMDLFQFAKTVMVIYLVIMGIFLVITYAVSLYQYKLSWEGTKRYHTNLKKLSQLYGEAHEEKI